MFRRFGNKCSTRQSCFFPIDCSKKISGCILPITSNNWAQRTNRQKRMKHNNIEDSELVKTCTLKTGYIESGHILLINVAPLRVTKSIIKRIMSFLDQSRRHLCRDNLKSKITIDCGYKNCQYWTRQS